MVRIPFYQIIFRLRGLRKEILPPIPLCTILITQKGQFILLKKPINQELTGFTQFLDRLPSKATPCRPVEEQTNPVTFFQLDISISKAHLFLLTSKDMMYVLIPVLPPGP